MAGVQKPVYQNQSVATSGQNIFSLMQENRTRVNCPRTDQAVPLWTVLMLRVCTGAAVAVTETCVDRSGVKGLVVFAYLVTTASLEQEAVLPLSRTPLVVRILKPQGLERVQSIKCSQIVELVCNHLVWSRDIVSSLTVWGYTLYLDSWWPQVNF